jgi:hypothetical protein
MRKYLVIHGQVDNHICLCTRSLQNLLIYEKNFNFFFINMTVFFVYAGAPVVLGGFGSNGVLNTLEILNGTSWEIQLHARLLQIWSCHG